MSGGPPRLQTARLVMAAHEAGDFEDLAAMWADPEVAVRIGGAPSSPEQTWQRMLRYRGLWALLGYGYWAVREAATGRYVGDVGFADFHRAIEPSIIGLPEAGWALAGWAHGQGFATEALAAALDWLDRGQVHDKAVCLIADDNRASFRVAEKGGFRPTCAVTKGFESTTLLTRDRPGARTEDD